MLYRETDGEEMCQFVRIESGILLLVQANTTCSVNMAVSSLYKLLYIFVWRFWLGIRVTRKRTLRFYSHGLFQEGPDS